MERNNQTAKDLLSRLKTCDAPEFEVLRRALEGDSRITVQRALASARRRIEREQDEQDRIASLYRFQQDLCPGVVLGLDEVGRGPLAGPLAVGGVVLPSIPLVAGLDDSKKVPAAKRSGIAEEVKRIAVAWVVEYVPAERIDEIGMTASLKEGFSRCISQIEESGMPIDAILLDGNPLHLDKREISVVKGDAKCASIAAASIVAKVERDGLMERYAQLYPHYGFQRNKGYASKEHREAILQMGLSPIHRKSFCTSFLQGALF